MFVSRVFSRVSRSSLRGISSSSRNQLPQIFTSGSLLVYGQSTNKWVPCQLVNAMHNMLFTNAASQQFWYSASPSTQPNEKEENSQEEETNNISNKLAKALTMVDDAASARASSVDDSSKDTAQSRIKRFRCTWNGV